MRLIGWPVHILKPMVGVLVLMTSCSDGKEPAQSFKGVLKPGLDVQLVFIDNQSAHGDMVLALGDSREVGDSYYYALDDGVMPCGYVLALVDDRERLLGLVKGLEKHKCSGTCDDNALAKATCKVKEEARACLKAQSA